MSMTSSNTASLDSAPLNERMLGVLKEAVSRSTSARSLSEKLGHAHNYVRRLLAGEIPLQMETLLQVLSTLGFPPELFFEQVFQGRPDADPVAVLKFYREGDGLPRDPFLDEVGPRIEALTHRIVDPHAAVESRRHQLDQLEERRFEEREVAKLALEELIREVLDDTECLDDTVPSRFVADLARACSTWAVIQRVSGYRDNACDMYSLAFGCLPPHGLHPYTEAECYQRAAYLLRDLAAPVAGLQFLHTARDRYLEAGDLEGVGKTLVDKGILLWNLGETLQAIREYNAALKILPSYSVRYRVSALGNLARCYEEENQLAAAIDHIRQACKLYSGRVDILAAQSLANKARIAGKLDLEAEVEESFIEAMAIYEQAGHPGYVLFAALDYADWLLATGRTQRLLGLADEMFSMAKHFRKNRLIDAALMEFVRTAKWGELTEELLKNTRRRLEAASHSTTFR